MKKSIQFFVVIFIFLLQFGCGAKMVRYVMDEPTFSDNDIQGISTSDEIIEISDTYKGKTNSDDSFWIVVKKDGTYHLGKLNVETREIKDLNPMSEDDYGEANSIYWDSFVEENLGAGGACIGACVSETPFGGTTDKYGLNAEKNIWGNPDNKVKVSYQYVKERSSTSYSTTTSWQSGATQTFSKGENVVTINISDGYVHAFDLRAGKYARYYPIENNNYLGLQADKTRTVGIVNVFTYILNFDDESANQKSFGATLENLPGNYIDGCVTKDGKTVCIIIDKPDGSYLLRKTPTKEIVKNLKMFRTIQ